MKEALFFEKQKNQQVQCRLCAHQCRIRPGNRGICGIRENQNGTLFPLNYGKLISAAVDPIEKKPLYHFLPGTLSFSICTAGCNFGCLFCQNADISQLSKTEGDENAPSVFGQTTSPERCLALARKTGSASIAYTYTEPTIFYEYALDTAKLGHAAGLKNIFVTNGYIMPEPLQAIQPYLDAANIDLKSFSDGFYLHTCKARLQPVLDTIKLMYDFGIWIELTTLLITGQNDSPEELQLLTSWIADLDPQIPWHVSAFHPAYLMQDIPPTSVQSIYRAIEIGKRSGLKYVYAGNLGGNEYQDTSCPNCGCLLLERTAYRVKKHIQQPACPNCRADVPVIL